VQTLTLRQAGAHTLTALDGRGRWARVGFEVQAMPAAAPGHAAPRASKTAADTGMTGASPATLR
jgi:penicillin-binding protein 1C